MIYFDNSATSRYKPKKMLDEMVKELSDSANGGRSAHGDALKTAFKISSCRSVLCDYLNANEIIFTKNCTEAINIVLFGILKHGDHVVTTVTEHNAVLRPLFALEKAGVITISVINPDRNLKINPCHVAKTIKENTALVALNAVSNVTGVINDFEKIGRIAAERKVPLLLDAAQALPHVKINMKAQNISYLAGAGHKGLHGPQGTGFLALNKMSDINPLIYGGTGTNSDSVYQPHNLPESLEAGTLNAAGIVGLCESVKWTIKNADKINAKISRLSGRLMFALKNMRNVEVYTPVGVDTGVISFNVKDADSTTVADILDKKYGSPAAEEEVRKIEMSDSISTRHHIHDTASFSHQRKKFARQQIRGHIVDAYRTLQAILCDAALRLHCPRIVHQQTDGIAAFQKNLGKRRHRCK